MLFICKRHFRLAKQRSKMPRTSFLVHTLLRTNLTLSSISHERMCWTISRFLPIHTHAECSVWVRSHNVFFLLHEIHVKFIQPKMINTHARNHSDCAALASVCASEFAIFSLHVAADVHTCFSLTSSLNGCLGQGYRLNTFDRIDFTTNACMHWMCVCPRVSVIVFVSFVTKFGIRSDHLFRVSEWQHFQYMPWFILATDRYHYFIVC